MHEYSKKILEDFQVRKSYRQKSEFLDYITDILEKHKIPYTIESKGKLFRSRNLVVGNFKEANTIITAHYDTQACLPIPNLITPLSWTGIILYNILIIVIIFGFAFFLGWLFSFIYIELSYISSMIGAYFLILYVFFGKANKHTANDNTSGVILLLELILSLEHFDDVCFVFFDLEEVGLIGSSRFKTQHKSEMKKDRILFNFDCISDGDTFYFKVPRSIELESLQKIFTSTESKKALITYKGYYPSDQMLFDFGIGCAALKKKYNIYYLDRIHTSKDIIFDSSNIDWYKEKMIDYISWKRSILQN